jgi:hypothetical protein
MVLREEDKINAVMIHLPPKPSNQLSVFTHEFDLIGE